MKRNTDVSRERLADVQKPPGTGTRSSGRAAAVECATALLVHGLQESDIPIANLSSALARMARTLSDTATPLLGGALDEPRPGTDLRTVRDAFARDLAVCIESLQFHDRLMQQLSRARDILTGLAPGRLSAKVPGRPLNGDGIKGSIELF